MRSRNWLLLCATLASPFLGACGPSGAGQPDDGGGTIPGGSLSPSDLVYVGAFRLPGPSDDTGFAWGGDAMAYFPEGDPTGQEDAHPGSLFLTGHDWHEYVAEVSIPTPVISAARDLAALNTAEILTPMTDVRAGVGQLEALTEIPRVGMEYLPAQGGQTTGKLYLCYGAHFQSDAQKVAAHMWCETDLTGSQGAWWVGDASLYSVNDYLFEIPASWAAAHTPGMRLATGRFRDGGWSGQGPQLYAIGPWLSGNPPAPDTRLRTVPLLQYTTSETQDPPQHTMDDYHHSDEWSGAAWLTTDDRAAVVFVGTKGTGDCWYGLPDGSVWEPPYPEAPEGVRGWWSTGFEGRMLFYDPADLAAVAAGTTEPHEPQPYATLNMDAHLWHVTSAQQKHHLTDCAFDRERGFLYVLEPFVDEDKPIVHVWRVE